jgi:hypothetical protein
MGWSSRKQRPVRMRAPLARTADLLVEEFGDELLIYDQRSDRAHCLSPAAARVWRACDATTTVEELCAALELDRGTLARALEELEACELLDSVPAAGVTRREATARLAKLGAAAATAPLIYSIAAPAPAMAATQAFCTSLGCPTGASIAAHRTFCSNQGCLLCQGRSCSGGSNSGSACVASCTNCTAALINQRCSKTGCLLNTPTACP